LFPLLSLLVFAPAIVLAQETPPDPSGAATLAADPGAPVDFVWVLMAAFLVMFMQPGFAMLEAGFCRAKNVANLMAKNLIDFALGSLVFMAVGFAFMFGDDVAGLIGNSLWFLTGKAYDVSTYQLFMFQMVFAATAATIVSGAVAERLKFKVYLIYTVVITALIYPIYGHWVWGGGWLSEIPFGLGHLDFAGSGVVHTVGGMVGLAGAMVLGPRIGKFGKDGKPRTIPGHSIALVALGGFILWFGWFGFNPGSTLSAHELRIAVVAVTTTLSAAAGVVTALLITYLKTKKWNVGMGINGAIAGLVAITAPAAWVEAWAAVVIGIVAGIVVVLGIKFLESRGIDDPVGAVSVHGFAGIWGLLSIGLLADGTYGNYTTDAPYVTGLFYGGGFEQLIAQAIGAVTVFVWAFGLGLVLFKFMDKLFGIRVSPEEEARGLDIIEHEGPAYPEFELVAPEEEQSWQ